MPTPARLLVAGALVLSAAGCAHAPSSGAVFETRDEPAPRMMVTGSRIARPVDPRTGEPATISPVRIYTRDDIRATGSEAELGTALLLLHMGASPGK